MQGETASAEASHAVTGSAHNLPNPHGNGNEKRHSPACAACAEASRAEAAHGQQGRSLAWSETASTEANPRIDYCLRLVSMTSPGFLMILPTASASQQAVTRRRQQHVPSASM